VGAAHGLALLNEFPCLWFDGKADHVKMPVTLLVGFARGIRHELTRYRAMLRAKDERHRFIDAIWDNRLGAQRKRLRRRPDVFECDRAPAIEP